MFVLILNLSARYLRYFLELGMLKRSWFVQRNKTPGEVEQQKCIICLRGWAELLSKTFFFLACEESVFWDSPFLDCGWLRPRDRINRKMHALQELIPNSDKVEYLFYNHSSQICSFPFSSAVLYICLAFTCFSLSWNQLMFTQIMLVNSEIGSQFHVNRLLYLSFHSLFAL